MFRPPRVSRLAAHLTLAALLAVSLGLSPAAAQTTIDFVSDTSWTVTDANAGVGPALSLPAPAQFVCLNTGPECGPGATNYGFSGTSTWGTDLTSIPGAQWIWAPGIDGSTTGPGDEYFFTRTFSIGTPIAGTLFVAVDDAAEVFVNGTSIGSTTDFGSLASFDMTPELVTGLNTIVVHARNRDESEGSSGPTYAEDPAGVVFGGSISFAEAVPAVPVSALPALIALLAAVAAWRLRRPPGLVS